MRFPGEKLSVRDNSIFKWPCVQPRLFRSPHGRRRGATTGRLRVRPLFRRPLLPAVRQDGRERVRLTVVCRGLEEGGRRAHDKRRKGAGGQTGVVIAYQRLQTYFNLPFT
jgi:hypothetical protein